MKIQSTPVTRLDHDLHIRVSKRFCNELHETAREINVKPSTLTRYVLMKHLQDCKSEVMNSKVDTKFRSTHEN